MQPSQAEANRVVAQLKGEVKKYTIEVYMKSGRVYEYQSDVLIDTRSDTATRTEWLTDGYSKMVCKMDEVEFIHTMDNPK